MADKINTLQTTVSEVIAFLVQYSFQVVGALIVLAVGTLVGNWTGGLLFKFLEKKRIDVTLAKFLATVVKIIVLTFAVIIALGKFGITIAPFIAALGAASFGASIALQGPLSNYGAGFSIILSRPFAVKDTITVAGVSGEVKDIKITSTLLVTEDGVQITIPNKHIVGEIVYNSGSSRISEGLVGIGYGADPEKAIALIRAVFDSHGDVCKAPSPPQVGIQAFGESSLDIGYRFWAKTSKYYATVYAVNLSVYKALEKAGIDMPFPQREVRILDGGAAAPRP